MKTLNITPDAHVIESIRRTNITYAEGLSELIDNSLDAGASSISIEYSPTKLTVSDNGGGCDDLEAMLTLGKHRPGKNTKLGRYGVGLKNTGIGLGDLLEVESRKDGTKRLVTIDWSIFTEWKAEQAEASTPKPNGTEITISRLIKGRMPVEKVAEQLSFTFTPALRAGKKISLVGVKLEPINEPEFSESVEGEEEWDGFGFRVKAGILASGRNDRKPFIIAYEHRVLFDTSNPCKDFSTGSKFFAWVELWGNWPLLKHKDGLSDHAQILFDALHEICLPLLEKAHEEGEIIELQGIGEELTEALLGIERRTGNKTKGTVEPVESPRTRKTAEDVHSKGSSRKRKNGGIIFKFGELSPERVGDVDDNGNRIAITLNVQHPFIIRWRTQPGRTVLRLLAVLLLAEKKSQPSKENSKLQMKLQIDGEGAHETFLKIAGELLRQVTDAETKQEEAA